MLRIVLCVCITTTIVLSADLLVQLPNGTIRGRGATSLKGKNYSVFEKIPYAAPPIGSLRFQAPIPPPNWEGVLDTIELDVSCVQDAAWYGKNVSEDCLYLNVYTPQLPSEGADESLPVMVFIYGGAFIYGTSINMISDPIIEKDVILVTFNYRLGALGFLSTQDDIIPGNNALKDQHLAIKWVHDNINLFGGNPKKITIFGQSAGSASCSYQLLSERSQGLFSGAILQSGSALSVWAYQRNARKIAFAIAAKIDDTFNSSNDSEALFEKTEYYVEILLIDQKHSSLEYAEVKQGSLWAPVIEVENDNAIITKKQYQLLQDGQAVAVPILIGMTSEETLGVSTYQNKDVLINSSLIYDEHLDWLLPDDMNVIDQIERQEIGLKIRQIYTGGEHFAGNLGAIVRFYSDTAFTRSIIKHAELQSKIAPTYFYQFSYDGELGGVDLHYDGAETVGHAEDLRYIFCFSTSCNFTTYPETDRLTSERLIELWTNFAKHQNPTPEATALLQNVIWPQVLTDEGDFLYMDINENLEIKNHPKEDTYAKWVAIYDGLDYSDFDTY